jgi:SPP1 family predicted phage head-tail adaptor
MEAELVPAAGTLDRRLTVLRRMQTGVDALNNPVFSFGELRTVWAAKIHKAEDEAFAASQRYATRTVVFRTRYQAVLETDRLLCEGITYDVKGVREIGRREAVEIAAETHNEAAE